MLQLKVVNTAEEKDDDKKTLNQGTKVLSYLVKCWRNSNRNVCTDSSFAYVQCAREFLKWRLRFLGDIKLSHKDYAMDFLEKRYYREENIGLAL
jgi:hypothetical protein